MPEHEKHDSQPPSMESVLKRLESGSGVEKNTESRERKRYLREPECSIEREGEGYIIRATYKGLFEEKKGLEPGTATFLLKYNKDGNLTGFTLEGSKNEPVPCQTPEELEELRKEYKDEKWLPLLGGQEYPEPYLGPVGPSYVAEDDHGVALWVSQYPARLGKDEYAVKAGLKLYPTLPQSNDYWNSSDFFTTVQARLKTTPAELAALQHNSGGLRNFIGLKPVDDSSKQTGPVAVK